MEIASDCCESVCLYPVKFCVASNLVCESDMNPGSVVGPTQCEKFIAPAEVPLSCSVPYNGGKAPQMTWSKSGDSSNSTITDCVTRNNRVTCNSTLTASLKLNGALYTCELKTQQYNCSLKINNILCEYSRLFLNAIFINH